MNNYYTYIYLQPRLCNNKGMDVPEIKKKKSL